MYVSILIISYNTRALTLKCIQSVFEQTKGVEFEVVVLDNASNDGSADAIAVGFPEAKLIRLEKNVGFACGNNLAAAARKGQFLLLLNPDTEILSGAVQKIVEFARKHPEAGIVGGRTFFNDRQLNRNSCHGRPTAWSMLCLGTGLASILRQSVWFNPESLGSWKRDTVREVDAVTGCFLLVDRNLWNKLGGFDESFFMYGEDTDLCIRAWKAGSKCMICPDARLIHYGGMSEKVRAEKMVKLFRAKAQLIQKHWSSEFTWFGIAMLKLWSLTRMLVSAGASIGIPSARISYKQWRQIWLRRAEYCDFSRTYRNSVVDPELSINRI